MAEFTEDFYYEYPEGYEPGEFEAPEVRSLEDLRADLTSDADAWKADLKATLTETYLPAEEVYEQEEIMRRFRYRIEDPEDDSPFDKEELTKELALIQAVFAADRERAKEWVEEAFAEEVSARSLAACHILESSADYKSGLKEDLLEGYEPASEDPSMPSGLWERTESLRKLLYQIDRLTEEEDPEELGAPFALTDQDEPEGLTPQDRELLAKDREHKEELNRRFDKKRELEDALVVLTEEMLSDSALWEGTDETDREEDRRAIEELRQEILSSRAA